MALILVVCTGNVCRSPIAEGCLRASMKRRLDSQAPFVSSAGTAGWEGSEAMPESIRAAAERGVEIGSHVARRLTSAMIADADLIVAMAREHADAVAAGAPDAVTRTFTLKELVRLLEALPPPNTSSPNGLAARVVEADRLRGNGFEGNVHDEDVSDPLGLPLGAFRAIAWELDTWCERLADGLFGHLADSGRVEEEG